MTEETHADVMDRAARVALAQMTGGLAPSTLIVALTDWWVHLATAPGKQAQLWEQAIRGAGQLALGTQATPELPRADHRFQSDLWQAAPFSTFRDSFLITEGWWKSATTGVRGVAPANQTALSFAVRQMLDAVSPGNFVALNPEVLARIRETQGGSLVQGGANLLAGAGQTMHEPDPDFPVGAVLAATPGKVVARNHLMELIQYTPTTGAVHPEPVLIVPAWIMKYYILDLSAQNSLVRWLVGQGFTVFMVSWRNPGPQDHEIGMADYLNLGPRAAMDAVQAITGATRLHAVGYCLGGTLLSIAAAAMARDGDTRLATLTLLAAQTDFSEAGELAMFISEAQVALLEDMMWQQGGLHGGQMAGAFSLLHANDLIWNRMIRHYLMGEEDRPSDLMVWNADATRMPYRMHSEYLRGMYLENRLANGRFLVDGRTVALGDLCLPIFAVGTETDHVAPWKSVFKIRRLSGADVTFVLTNGGHNAGVVSEPGHPHHHYRIATTLHDAPGQDAESWLAAQVQVEGSWWPAWAGWLTGHSGSQAALPPMGRAGTLGDAPGTYILQR